MDLIFLPRQPHYLLEAAGRTLTSGETFEGPRSLLAGDDVQKAPATASPPEAVVTETNAGETHIPPTHSPDRAQRAPTPTRSEDK